MSTMRKTPFILTLSILTLLAFACGSESEVGTQTPEVPPTLQPPTPPTPPSFSPPTSDQTSSGSPGGNSSSGGSSSGGSSSGGSSSGGSSGSTDDGGTADPTDGGGDGGDQDAGGGDPLPPPTSTVVGGVQIDLVSVEGNTFCYQVTELDGAKDLSHWDLATNCTVLSGTPTQGFVIGKDPKSGLTGVKWNVSSAFTSGVFCVTVDGQSTTGTVQVASKSGYPISYGTIAGPVCQ